MQLAVLCFFAQLAIQTDAVLVQRKPTVVPGTLLEAKTHDDDHDGHDMSKPALLSVAFYNISHHAQTKNIQSCMAMGHEWPQLPRGFCVGYIRK